MRSLLQDFQPTACTVAYDRVYALISLSRDGYWVHMDYSCPMIDVFCKVVSLGENEFFNAIGTVRLAAELGLSSAPGER
jgi:hypothetical protein